jgi:hypothetical protein
MHLSDIKKRVDQLAASDEFSSNARGELAFQQYQSALSVLVALYGKGSSQVESFIRDKDKLVEKWNDASTHVSPMAIAAIRTVKNELDAGFVGNLEATISGEVLSEFIGLARLVLEENKTESKNVAAVLAAAAFEDALRRLAKNNGIPHIEKLADVLNELKTKGIIQGTQVGVANSYLNFRNNALHADWHRIERASVVSI